MKNNPINLKSALVTWITIALVIYFIVKFFLDFNYVYLICGTIIPLISFLTSSQYFAGKIFSIIVITGSAIGFFYFNFPLSYFVGVFGIYFILFKILRTSFGLTGNYIPIHQFEGQEKDFIKALFTSVWYESNKNKTPDQLKLDDLINRDFYKKNVDSIIKILIQNNLDNFNESTHTRKKLLEIHALGIIQSLPYPLIKNEGNFISIGSQLLLNIFSNLESINKYGVDTDKQHVYIEAIENIKKSNKKVSEKEFSQVF